MSLIAAQNEITRWTHEADELAEAGDWERLGDGLARIRDLKRQLSVLERHVEDHVAALMPEKRIVVPGLGLERRTSKDRKAWKSEDILTELWMQSWTTDTGEVVDDATHSAQFLEAVRECVPFTGSLGWRVRALEAYGIDPDEYAEVTPGRTSVQTWKPEESDE